MFKSVRNLAVAAAMVAIPVAAQAQGVGLGYTDVGVVVGFGGASGAGVSFGGRFERIIKELPDLGNGLLGIMASVDVFSSTNDFAFGSTTYRYIPIGVTANYHFVLENKKVDPFLGVGLGYRLVNFSCDYNGIGNLCGSASYNSGIVFIGRAGIRYFFKDNMALYADAGAGGSTLNGGITFKLK
jgi:hypothetical protein